MKPSALSSCDLKRTVGTHGAPILSSSFVLIFCALFFATTAIPEVQAAQVKQVQRGTAGTTAGDEAFMDSDETVTVATLSPPVDLTKSIVIASCQNAATQFSGHYFWTAEFADASTVLFTRGLNKTSSATMKFDWTVVEFKSGVNVYAGSAVWSSLTTELSKTITLPVVSNLNRSKAFVIVSSRSGKKGTDDGTALVRAQLNDSNQLILTRNNQPGLCVASYQVVEILEDVKVQHNDISFTASDTTKTTGTLTTFDKEKSLIFLNFKASQSGTSMATYETRGYPSNCTGNNCTTLTFERVTASGTVDVTWYLVEFTDGSFVQNYTSGSGTVASTAVTLGSVNLILPRTFHTFSEKNSATSRASTRSYLSSATNLQLNAISHTSSYAYSVAETPPVKVISPNGGTNGVANPEQWHVGTEYPITWEYNLALETGGSGDATKCSPDAAGCHVGEIQLSLDGGSTWLSTNVNDEGGDTTVDLTTGSYSWTIPETIGGTSTTGVTCKIRIVDTDYIEDTSRKDRRADVSNDVFTIKGNIDLIEPDGGEVWGIGSNQDILWDQWGNYGNNIKIYYNKNGGSWTEIATVNGDSCSPPGTPGTGGCKYDWDNIPGAAAGTQIKIKVEASTDTSVTSQSPNYFEINPDIIVLLPDDSNAKYLVGREHTIKWSCSGTVNDFNFTYNPGTGFVVPPGVPSPLTTSDWYTCDTDKYCYNWQLDPTTGKTPTAQLRISMDGSTTVKDESDYFPIVASVQFDNPLTSAPLRCGLNTPIYWSSPGGGLGQVTIKYTKTYSTCQSQPYDNVCWLSMPGAGALGLADSPYQWAVPTDIVGAGGTASDVGLLVVENTHETDIFDKRGAFTNVKSRIVMSQPHAKEVLRVDNTKLIQWTLYGTMGTVDVCLIQNGTGSTCDQTIATGVSAAGGQVNWTNIPDWKCNECTVKVYKVGDDDPETGIAAKSGVFSLKGNITAAVRDAISYNVGNTATITWTATPAALADSVRIRYDSNNGLGTDGLANTADDYAVVLDTVAASVQTYGWDIDISQPLVNGTGKVRVEYVDYGLAEELAGTIENGGKIVSDTTAFSLKGTLVLTDGTGLNKAKSGGVTWNIGQAYTITWQRGGTSMGNVDIKYSKDGGTNWNLIATKPSADESYSWCVGKNDGCSGTGGVAGSEDDAAHTPSLVIDADKDADIKVRVESVDDRAGINDCTGTEGDACTDAVYLTLQKRFINIGTGVPANTVLYVGDTNSSGSGPNSITWTTEGIGGSEGSFVKLRFDTNSGSDVPTPYSHVIVDGISDVQGYHLWQVPDFIGDKVRIRVLSNSNSDVYGDMTSDFTIKGKIVLGLTKTIDAIAGTGIQNTTPIRIKTTTDHTFTTGQVATISSSSFANTFTVDTAVNGGITDTTPVKIKTTTSHGYSNGTRVAISSAGVSAIDGTWYITVVDADEFTLNGSSASGAGGDGSVAASVNGSWTITKVDADEFSLNGTVASGNGSGGIVGIYTILPQSASGVTTLIVGKPATLNYIKYGTVGNLQIDYVHKEGSNEYTTPLEASYADDTQYIWPAVSAADSDSSPNNVIDSGIAGTTNSKFILTGTGQAGALQATLTTPWIRVRGEIYKPDTPDDLADTLVVPYGGETFTVGGSTTLIKWHTHGDLGNVRIRLDLDEGKGPNGIAGDSDDYCWGSGCADSKLTGPGAIASGESVPYNYDGDGAGTECASNDPENTPYCWEWTVPNLPSIKARIRIESIANPASLTNGMATYGTSNANFRIRPTLNVTNPDGVQSPEWVAGQTGKSIRFTSSASADVDVWLCYSEVGAPNCSDYIPLAENHTVTALAPAEEAINWNVPSNFSTRHAILRVKWSDDPSIADSGAEFRIKPDITLSSPVANAKWYVNNASNYTISWQDMKGSNLNSLNFKIKISYDGGNIFDPTALSDSVPATNLQFGWKPTLASQASNSDTVIRVSDVADDTVYWDSPQFNVFPDIDLVQPNGTVNLPINTDYLIKWTVRGTPGTSSIEYTTNGTDWLVCENSSEVQANSINPMTDPKEFNWRIPIDAPTSTIVKIRISENANPDDVRGISLNNNAIIGSIIVDRPNASDEMVVGNPFSITYARSSASIDDFKIEYYSGGTWYPIIGSTTDYPTYVWPSVDDRISTPVIVRVTDNGNTDVFGESNNGNLTVNTKIRGSLILTAPDTENNPLVIGTPYNISWTKTGDIGNIKIELSTDDFVSDIREIHSGYSGGSPYPWTPAIDGSAAITYADMNAAVFKVRVTSLAPTLPQTDKSQTLFKVNGLISNVGTVGTVWYKDDTNKRITWTETGNIEKVVIKYKTTTAAPTYTKTVVAEATGYSDGDRYYDWPTVPDEKSDEIWFQVADFNNPTEVKAVFGPISIRPKITVNNIYPAINTVFRVGTHYPAAIQWDVGGSTNVTTVDILYSITGIGGTYDKTIATGVDASLGTIDWLPSLGAVADDISDSVVIKVLDKTGGAGNANVFGLSNPVKIKGSLTLAAPADGTTWYSNVSQDIQWTTTGTTGFNTVKAYYDLDSSDGLVWLPIGTAPRGDGSLAWVPPTTVTNKARIKITNLADETDVTDANEADFKLSAKLDVNADSEDGVSYNAESTAQTIHWTVTNGATGIGNIKLYYSNNGTAPTPVWIPIAEVAGTETSYTWNPVPRDYDSITSVTHKFKVTQSNPDNELDAGSAGNALAIGAGVFPIYGNLTVTSPTTSDSWSALSPYTIRWTKKGNIKTVKILYAVDGTNYDPTPVVSSLSVEDGAPGSANREGGTDAGPYFYVWTIPTETALSAGAVARIKVVAEDPASQNNVNVSVASNPFEVKGSVAVATPTAANTVLVYNTPYNITWTKGGNIQNVKLYYSTNGGTDWASNPINGGASVPATPTTFPWTVPDKIGNNLVIRIADANNPNVFDVSDNPFEIHGGLQIDQPKSPDVTFWYVGDPHVIQWTPIGTYGTAGYCPLVEFHYDRDGFGSGVAEASVAPDAEKSNTNNGVQGTANWTIPDAISAVGTPAQVRVRVKNSPTPVQAISDTFRICGKIPTINRPTVDDTGTPAIDETEIWIAGSTNVLISWDATGTVTPVNIYYKTSAGGSWIPIAEDLGGKTSGTNTYTWANVPADLKTNNAYIRIEDDRHPNETYQEQGPFRILPELEVNSPVVTDLFRVNNTETKIIKWTQLRSATGVGLVNLYYSTNGGSTYSPVLNDVGDPVINVPVANGLPPNGGIDWKIPNVAGIIGDQVRIKVADAASGFSNVYAQSPIFKVRGNLTFTAPTATTKWVTNTVLTNAIAWDYSGPIQTVKVSYDLDNTNGDQWTWIANKAQADTQGSSAQTWDLVAAGITGVTNKARIKIEDGAYPDHYVISPIFKLIAAFTVISPINGAPTYVYDSVINPNKTTIQWSTDKGTGLETIRLYYTNNSGAETPTWNPIVTLPGDALIYDWETPGEVADLDSLSHKIKVVQFFGDGSGGVDYEGASAIDSGGAFPIKDFLKITEPATSQSWGVGPTAIQTIKFKKAGKLTEVELYYAYDGVNYTLMKRQDDTTTIDTSGAPDGDGNYSFPWFLDPDDTSLTSGFSGRIKAKAKTPALQANPLLVQSLPSVAIEVKGSVTLVAPTGAVSPMKVGDLYTIKWDKFGSVENVQIHYSINGGSSYPNLIYDGPAVNEVEPNCYDTNKNCSTLDWDVPNSIGTNIKVRVQHKENTSVKDESSQSFRIKGDLQINQPSNSGIVWKVGDIMQGEEGIKWTSTGTFSPLSIDYSTNGDFNEAGRDITLFAIGGEITNCTPTSGNTCTTTLNWGIPNKITANAKIRIRGTGNEEDVETISANPFKIVGKLDITVPETGQIWYANEGGHNITWNATGTVTNVNIGYRIGTASGLTGCNFTNIVSNDGGHTELGNTYAWAAVADVKSEAVYVCIQDANFPTNVADVSAAPFSIRPKITVTTPANGARVMVGSNNDHLIQFTVDGAMTTHVNVVYTINDGADGYNKTIALNVPKENGPDGIDWDDVPAPLTQLAKIKVYDVAEGSSVVSGVSPGNFKIVGDVTIINPPAVEYSPKIMLRKGGTNFPIQWINKKGAVANVTIKYSTEGVAGNFNKTIVTQTAAGSSENEAEPNEFPWAVIPDTPSAHVVIRISDYDDPETKSFSQEIALQSNFNITSPDDGEVFAVADVQDIHWTTDGNTQFISLEYATNGGGESGNWEPVLNSLGQPATNIPNTGIFPWKVPNISPLSEFCKVRVYDHADPDNWNESTNTFKIRANFTMEYPDGGEEFTVGDTVPIRWFAIGAPNTVRLEYSKNGGAYTKLTTPTNAEGINAITGDPGCTANPPCWNWQVHDIISPDVKVRVVYEDDPTTLDASDASFKVYGQLSFNPTLPLTGDGTWYVGDTKVITLAKQGTIAEVILQYTTVDPSFANEIDYIPVHSGVITSSIYNWAIPNLISTTDPATNPIHPTVWLRAINKNEFEADGQTLREPTHKALTSVIDLRGKIVLSAPLGTSKWEVDSSQTIRWTPKGNMGTLELEYSVNDFETPLPVLGPNNEPATALPAGTHNVLQSFTWKIPSNISGNAKVRITPNTSGQADVVTSLPFNIIGGFKVLTPNGGAGQYFEVDGSTSITWERYGSIATARIEFSTNGFNNENETYLIDEVPATDGSYSWTIPAETTPGSGVSTIGANVKVRVSDPLYNGTSIFTNNDKSDQPFEIRGKIDINSPVGGEIWLITSDQMLQWTKHGTISSVKVEYDTDPADAFDFTDPATGQPNYVKNAAGNPASSVAGTDFNWRIPDTKSLNKARIKVTNLSDPTHVFTITPTFTIRAGFAWTNPNTAGQVFFVNAQSNITWSTFGTVNTVDIKYFTEGNEENAVFVKNAAGTDADNVLNEQTFPWKIPNNISKNIFIRIIDSTDPDAQKTSEKVKIAGVLHMDAPTSGVRWPVGTSKLIDWHTDGDIANVKLEYTTNASAQTPTWSEIEASWPGNTDKSWLIPPNVPLSTDAKIRISDVITDSGTVTVESPIFKFVGNLTITTPSASNIGASGFKVVEDGEVVVPPSNIVWATQGGVSNVNLYYRVSGGAWQSIAGPIGNASPYPWNVADVVSNAVEVMIEDANDTETNDISDVFEIIPVLNLTSPIGHVDPALAEKWRVSESNEVTWQRNGTGLASVYLYYSLNYGTSWIPFAANPIPNTGSYFWPVPTNVNLPSGAKEQAKVKVEEKQVSPVVSSASPNNFKIMAYLDVTDPEGGTTIVPAGQNYPIHWNFAGNLLSTVDIDLALDGDQPSPNYNVSIANNVPNNAGLYSGWNVPTTNVTPRAKIRIRDHADPDAVSYSASPFVIRANFVFLEPSAAGQNLQVGETYQIRWQKVGDIPSVQIQYSPQALAGNGNLQGDIRFIEPTSDGLVSNANCGDPTEGCYNWPVPDIEDLKDTNLHLRIRDPNDNVSYVISPAFNIIPKFQVLTPNGDSDSALTDKLKVGTPYEITWNSSSNIAKTPSVILQYTTSGGEPYSGPITTTANDGSYIWVTGNGGVPDTISDQVKIRVLDASDQVAFDDSNDNLKIISDPTLSAPNGNATYEVGDPFTIIWTNKGTVPNVELSYSTTGSDFSSPVVFANSIDNGSDFGASYNWTIPDAIGTNVRVRVRSLSDDGYDISDADFRIRGKLVPLHPAVGEKALIGQSFTIQWQTYGSVPTVKIDYDISDGTGGYPNSIIATAPNCTPTAPATPCTGSFVWNNIPDTPAPQAKIRIMDTRANESDVLTITDRFSIVGNLTVVTPNGGQDWRVNEPNNIVWTWGGTIPGIKLYYTKEPGDPETVSWTEIDPGTAKNYATDGLQQDGANNTIQRSYPWTVPDDISTTVRVKIADASNLEVYDVSNAPFKIRGDFTVTSPNGNASINDAERWVTSVYTINEGHNITWTTAGTIPYVKLQYSNDNFVDDIHDIDGGEADGSAPNCVPQNQELSCNASFYWEIPDAVIKDGAGKYTQYNAVKVRVLDVGDEEVFDASDNPFKIDYYNVKWIVRDLSTYNLLGDLGVSETKTTDLDFIQWQEGGIGVTQQDPNGYTRVVPTPAGSWLATWSKTGYGDLPQVVTLSKNNPFRTKPDGTPDPLPLDPSYQLLMETTTVHIYAAEGRFTYDPGLPASPGVAEVPDKLDIVAWLARDGSMLTGVVNARVYIYEGATIVTGNPVILSQTGSSETGLWNAQILNPTDAPFNLKSGVTYVGKMQMQIASQVPNDVWYQTPTSFEITTPRKLQDVIDQVNYALDKPISEVETGIQTVLAAQTNVLVTTLAAQTTTIETKLEEQKNAIDATLTAFTESVEASLIALETGAQRSLEAGEQLKATAERFSWKTSSTPNPALTGDTVTIAAQGLPGLKPVLSIYNFENKAVVASGAMKESDINPGNYAFAFEPDPGLFQAGKAYTFIVSEDTTGGLVGGSGFIESTSLTTIAGLVASAPGAETAAKKALDAIKGIEAAMTKGGDIAGVKDQMMALKDLVVELPNQIKELAKGDTGIKDVTNAVNSISSQLTNLAGTEGYDLSQLMSKAISEAPSVKDLRRKADAITTGVDIVQKTIEAKLGGADEPIIAVSYTSGSVIVRVVVVNPSESKAQEVPVKVYLPQETKPDDVIDKGDLEFGFDEMKSIYFVYKDKVMLQPKETRVFEVELQDIWFIPEEKLNGLKVQTEKIMERLKETPYFDQAKIVADTIFGRLDRISTTQADESVNKELHIGLYRANLIVLAKVKEDIAKLEKMMVAVGAPPAPEMLAESKLNLKTPSRATTWFIIFAIMVFIGLLGFVFFITWQTQVKGSSGSPEDQDGTSSKTEDNSGQPPSDAT